MLCNWARIQSYRKCLKIKDGLYRLRENSVRREAGVSTPA